MLCASLATGSFGVISAWVDNIYVLIVVRVLLGMTDCIAYLAAVFLGKLLHCHCDI